MAYVDNWTTDTGTMDVPRLRERKLYCAQVEVFAEGTVVWWSRDGTDSGVSLFTISTSIAPWVEVMMMSDRSDCRFTDLNHFGPMFASGESLAEGQYMWLTSYDVTATLWKTQLWFGGSSAGNSEIEVARSARTALIYAMCS